MRIVYWTADLVIDKDPSAEKFYEFSWAEWLPTGATIASSTWTLDAGLTYDNPGIINAGLGTQLRVKGGTAGQQYRATNRVVTNQVPPQTDEKSVTFNVVQQ